MVIQNKLIEKENILVEETVEYGQKADLVPYTGRYQPLVSKCRFSGLKVLHVSKF